MQCRSSDERGATQPFGLRLLPGCVLKVDAVVRCGCEEVSNDREFIS